MNAPANASGSMVYEFENFRIDTAKRHLLDSLGNAIALTPKAFDTLLYLVGNNERVVEKDELMSAIWPDTIVEENSLNKNISVLRRVLGDDRSNHRFIVTIPGKGYKFVAAVSDLSAPTDRTEPFKDAPKLPTSGKTNRYIIVVLGIAAIGASAMLGSYFLREKKTAEPITSVAVLPFVNVTKDAELDYLSDGLSETLIDRLSELPQLKVIARSSSSKYREENTDLQEVALKLAVRAIVTGRITRRGDDLTIRVELIDAHENKQLWGEQFNRKANDALALEGEIAQTISSKLSLKLSGAQETQLVKRGTDSPQAYDLLLKGDFFERRGGEENWKKAKQFYDEAITLDQNYALPYARLALLYQRVAGNSGGDPKEVLPKAAAAAKRAVELDDNLADAHLALANLARDEWDWKKAEQEYVRALDLNPNLIAARRRYSSFLSDLGRHDEAIAEAIRARELDPQRLGSYQAVPLAFLAARRFDESIAESKKMLEIDPDFYGPYNLIGFAYYGKGMYREAIAAYRDAIKHGNNELFIQIYLGAAYARLGERDNAEGIRRRLESSKEYVSPGEMAILYAALGDNERAIESLEDAYAAHDLQMQHLNADAGFDPLRDHPRFQSILRRVGLP